MLNSSSQGLQDLAAVLPHHFICQSFDEMYSCHISACPYAPLAADSCLASLSSQNLLMLRLLCNHQFAFLQAHKLAMAHEVQQFTAALSTHS